MTTDEKEVYFDVYCEKCVHFDDPDEEDPCNECLSYPMNYDSHKPVRFKERGDKV